MSFGFSIGDIILLSGIAYDIYTSLSTGRKGASKDLKELEDVLFSLRCALDHLGEVAKDVPENSKDPKAIELKQNLNRMIQSCGSTLQELDSTTRKYREVVVEDEREKSKTTEEMQAGVVKRQTTFESVKKRAVVNWKKVRWDQEKQNLQQYREKLRSHTDAINIILNSIMWSNANNAEATSKTNHERTHTLLNQVLTTSQSDNSLIRLVQEIHSLLTKPQPLPDPKPQPSLTIPMAQFASSEPIGGFGKPRFSLRSGLPGPGSSMRSVAAFNATSILTTAQHTGSSSADTSETLLENVLLRGDTLYEPTSLLSENWNSSHLTPEHNIQSIAAQEALLQKNGPFSEETLEYLNIERRAYGEQEFNRYKQRHPMPAPTPSKPSFLDVAVPDLKQIQSALGYVFRPLPEGRTDSTRAAINERSKEIIKWIETFRQFISLEGKSDGQVDLLVALNRAMETTGWQMRQLFYKASDQVKLMELLEGLQESSKSVRIMKEIEEFQDAREEWEVDLK